MNPQNSDYVTSVKCISSTVAIIQPIFLIFKVNILHNWCRYNDLDGNIVIDTTETGDASGHPTGMASAFYWSYTKQDERWIASSYHWWLWLKYGYTISQLSYWESDCVILPPNTLWISHSAFRYRCISAFQALSYRCNWQSCLFWWWEVCQTWVFIFVPVILQSNFQANHHSPCF